MNNQINKYFLLTIFIVLSFSFLGCGTYRITYVMPSAKISNSTEKVKTEYSHGVGLIGGAALFFAIHRMFPCWVDYTGGIDLSYYYLNSQDKYNGVYKVEQYHSFGQNTVSALLSCGVILNTVHSSVVQIYPVLKPVSEVQKTQPVIQKQPQSTSLENMQNELKKLEDMKDNGLITNEEYIILKAKVGQRYK